MCAGRRVASAALRAAEGGGFVALSTSEPNPTFVSGFSLRSVCELCKNEESYRTYVRSERGRDMGSDVRKHAPSRERVTRIELA